MVKKNMTSKYFRKNGYELPPVLTIIQCMGKTMKGNRCKITSISGMDNMKYFNASNPLRNGGKYCTFHIPSIQCKGVTKNGTRCKIFSTSNVPEDVTRSLKEGKDRCLKHLKIDSRTYQIIRQGDIKKFLDKCKPKKR